MEERPVRVGRVKTEWFAGVSVSAPDIYSGVIICTIVLKVAVFLSLPDLWTRRDFSGQAEGVARS